MLLFLSILTVLISCNGQTSNKKKVTDEFTNGESVSELGNSIIAITQAT